MGMLSKFLNRGGPQPDKIVTTAESPFRIKHPVIGFYCPEPSLLQQMQEDKATLGPLFDAVREGTRDVPQCNVLCVYARLNQDGSLATSPARLRDQIKKAGARVAIVASENPPEHLFKAVKPDNDWPANIVLTIGRKGDSFAGFFVRFFQAMRSGRSMLAAWVELAPQGPGAAHADCPQTMLLAEAGHVAFARSDTYVN